MITAAAVMTIKSQIVLSLGMVGALSIVRFRAAIKSPMDIVFMFWAITAGIISGAGLYILALVTSVVLGLVTFVIYLLRNVDKPYMLVVNFDDDTIEENVVRLINSKVKKFNVKGRVVTAQAVELTVELRLKEGESRFVNDLQKVKGVQSASLVSFSGDYSA
jgi:uncharacterized membrane protein YhiD involved in acid resistance